VFERSYRAIGTFQDRVRAEAADLGDKLAKLQAFFSTDVFAELPAEECERLLSQAAAMNDYSSCLAERIQNFEPAFHPG
jgi:hypothetical protein